MAEKSANQLYKESKSSLSFKDWIEREKDKGIYIKNQLLADVTGQEDEPENSLSTAKFDFGIPKWVIISGAIVIVGAFVYKRYKK